MEGVKPDIFFDALLATLTAHATDVAGSWDKKADCYTQLIRGTILPDVGKRIGLKCCPQDYYTLDCIYYEDCDVDNFRQGSTYAKYIAVAVEHENDVRGSVAEMNKLQLFNAPLKVLITYAPDSTIQHWLVKYTQIIRNADYFGDIATLRRQLIVFGDRPDKVPLWRGFVYGREGFTEIKKYEMDTISLLLY